MSKQDIPSFTESAQLAKGEKQQPRVMEPAPLVPQATQKLAPPTPEAPPRSLFNGMSLKLAVYGPAGTDPMKPVPGHELYWFPDKDGGLMINQAIASGWRFVEKAEVALSDAPTSPGNDDVGDNVRRWTGQTPDGRPIHDYLMKLPDWLYAKHMQEREKVHQQLEEQLAMGTYKVSDTQFTYTPDRAPGAAPNVRSGMPGIKIGRYYRAPPKAPDSPT